MLKDRYYFLLKNCNLKPTEKQISEKILENQRIDEQEALYLYQKSKLDLLSLLSSYVREKLNGKNVYYNKNIHIEPSNICIYNCKFCSFRRRFNDSDAWNMTIDEILELVEKHKESLITEIHITGGVHPHYNLFNYASLIRKIKQIMPQVHIKAFTAIEIDYMCKKANVDYAKGLKILKEAGLDSLPGGGAEIFNSEIRQKIAYEKSNSKIWLEIHKTAHQLNIPSNATILFGHIEKYEHRVDHLSKIRQLQDQTKGFNTFIPLKFKNANNQLSDVLETTIIDDMKNFAVSRIFLDNIPHLKFYWVNYGRQYAQISLNYGVDDLDGTINDTTKIYTMAGSDEQKPVMFENEIINTINAADYIAVERNSVYQPLKHYFPSIQQTS